MPYKPYSRVAVFRDRSGISRFPGCPGYWSYWAYWAYCSYCPY